LTAGQASAPFIARYSGFWHFVKASPYQQLHESAMQAVQNARIIAHDDQRLEQTVD